MDGNRFIVWTAGLVDRSSRRTIAGGLLALVGMLLASEQASAACNHVGRKCRRDKHCCSRRCRRRKCRPGPGTCTPEQDICTVPIGNDNCNGGPCACFTTMEGAKRCGKVDPPFSFCGHCTKSSDCVKHGFGRDAFCVKNIGTACACGPDEGFCAQHCPT